MRGISRALNVSHTPLLLIVKKSVVVDILTLVVVVPISTVCVQHYKGLNDSQEVA